MALTQTQLERIQRLRAQMETAAKTLTDEIALKTTLLFPVWRTGAAYAEADRVQHNGTLYACIQQHTAQADWTPDAAPALWKVVSLEEWPEWVQPTGVHDAYDVGAKVTYNGKRWTSDIAANVYEPGVYGWSEVS